MSHYLHGDISEADKKVAEELLEMESHFGLHAKDYGPEECARVYVCLSHDWYELEDDDKGRQLLEKADKVCPGYFENQIKEHMKDPDFDYLVGSLAGKILAVARSIVGQMDLFFVCRYCNFSWRKKVYTAENADKKCLKCNDKNLIVKKLDEYRVDAYQGCPPFPEKKEEVVLEDSTGFPFYWQGD